MDRLVIVFLVIIGPVIVFIIGCYIISARRCRRSPEQIYGSPTMIYAVPVQGAIGHNFEEMLRNSISQEYPPRSFSGLTNSQTGMNLGMSSETGFKPQYNTIDISPPSYQEALAAAHAQRVSDRRNRSSTPPPDYN